MSLSTVQSNPIDFFKAIGYEVSVSNKKRDALKGEYDGISITGYFGENFIIEACVSCQLNELEETIMRLKELRNTVKEMAG